MLTNELYCKRISLLIALLIAAFLLTYQRVAFDFWLYFNSCRLLLEGFDPYQMQPLPSGQPGAFVWNYNLPHSFTPVLPLALLPFDIAQLLWFFVLAGSLSLPALLLPIPKETRLLSLPTFILLTFFPAYSGLFFGQLSQLLVGIMTIFYARTLLRGQSICGDFWAGCVLSVATIKPHSVYLVFLYLLIQSVRRQQYRTIIGLICGAAILFSVPIIIQPTLIESWVRSLAGGGAIGWNHATIATNLKIYLGHHTSLLLSISPTIVAAVIATFMSCTCKEEEDSAALPILVAISSVTAPYGWSHDYSAILPGLLLYVCRAPRRFGILVLAANICGIILTPVITENVFVAYPLFISVLMYTNRSWLTDSKKESVALSP